MIIMTYIIASHTLFHSINEDVYGPAHSIYDFLKEKKVKPIFIKHSIYKNHPSIIVNGNLKTRRGKFYRRNILIKSIEDVWINIKEIKRLNKPIYYIAVDPVNALSGVILKKTSKLNKFVYFSVDYANNRFDNFFLNQIYHAIDKICLKYADEVWSVSTRILAKRKLQGVSHTKNKLLPNSPEFSKVPRYKYNGNNNLIVVSHLSKSLHLEVIFEIVKELSHIYKKLRINIIGDGPERKRLEQLVIKQKLKKQVYFLGQKSHRDALQYISRSFIGFALYTADHPWRHYGDSMKTREYVACGIPVVINDIPSTADDIKKYNAGLVINKLDKKEISNFIEKCIKNRKYYESVRRNAYLLGERFDKKIILSQLFNI